MLRASTIHGLAGMAAIMASTYKAYLGEGLGPLSWIQRFKIPHPGRVRVLPHAMLSLVSKIGCSAVSYWALSCEVLNEACVQFTCLAVAHHPQLLKSRFSRAMRHLQVGGYLAMNLTMPTMLSWVLGGNVQAFAGSDRNPHCVIAEKPKHFHEQVCPAAPSQGLMCHDTG